MTKYISLHRVSGDKKHHFSIFEILHLDERSDTVVLEKELYSASYKGYQSITYKKGELLSYNLYKEAIFDNLPDAKKDLIMDVFGRDAIVIK